MENKLLVIITTYSRGENLPAVVDSVVKQTFKNYKILICDDHSPNDPTEIINGIKSKYPNVNIESYRNHINVGEGVNINIALGKEFHNDFKYLVLLQDDTVYLDNNFLEIGIQMLEQNPDASYVFGLMHHYLNGELCKLLNLPKNKDSLKITGIELWRNWEIFALNWAGCIFRYLETVEYRLSYRMRKDVLTGDLLMLMRLAMNSNVVVINKRTIDVCYNTKGRRANESTWNDPIHHFIQKCKWYNLSSEYAVEHGASKQEAEVWLLNHQLGEAFNAINRIGNNKELRQKFMNTLMDYDRRIALSLLNNTLNSIIR